MASKMMMVVLMVVLMVMMVVMRGKQEWRVTSGGELKVLG